MYMEMENYTERMQRKRIWKAAFYSKFNGKRKTSC